MKNKPFTIAFVRDAFKLYEDEEITYSRFVELLNEQSLKFHSNNLEDSVDELTQQQSDSDNYLQDNIIEARNNREKAYEAYRNYVSEAETDEERLRRIKNFRCGGW